MPSDDRDVTMTVADRAVEFDKWRDYIIDSAGNVSLDHVLQELHDYRMLLQEVPQVYYAITCGKLSKANYMAESVIATYQECSEHAVREILSDVLERLEEGETTDDIRRELDIYRDDPRVEGS